MSSIRKAFAAGLLLFIPMAWLAAVETSDTLVAKATKEITSISAAEAKKMIDGKGAFILDVREADEYLAGIIPGAVNIPRGLLEFSIAAKVKNQNQPIIVYCRKGGRGALACQTLQIMGYTKVYNLTGGFTAWQAAAYPMEKGKI